MFSSYTKKIILIFTFFDNILNERQRKSIFRGCSMLLYHAHFSLFRAKFSDKCISLYQAPLSFIIWSKIFSFGSPFSTDVFIVLYSIIWHTLVLRMQKYWSSRVDIVPTVICRSIQLSRSTHFTIYIMF